MSRTQRILQARKKIMNANYQYAFYVREWEMKKEEDINDLIEMVDKELEALLTNDKE